MPYNKSIHPAISKSAISLYPNIPISLSLMLITLTCLFKVQAMPADNPPPGTVIIPASDFLQEIPKGNIITDAGTQRVTWLFNNTGLVLKSETNLMTQVNIPQDGKYYLFVRSLGTKGSSFKVAVNDKVTDSIFGNQELSWRQGGSFNLKQGITNIKITRIDPGAVVSPSRKSV